MWLVSARTHRPRGRSHRRMPRQVVDMCSPISNAGRRSNAFARPLTHRSHAFFRCGGCSSSAIAVLDRMDALTVSWRGKLSLPAHPPCPRTECRMQIQTASNHSAGSARENNGVTVKDARWFPRGGTQWVAYPSRYIRSTCLRNAARNRGCLSVLPACKPHHESHRAIKHADYHIITTMHLCSDIGRSPICE